VFDQAVGCIDYGLGGSVILLQPVFFGLWKVVGEIQDILYPGPPEGINALGVIPHYGYVAVFLRQTFNDQVLCQVGVLIFIYQDVAETVPVKAQYLWVLLKQYVGIEQQVIKIHSAGQTALFGIQCENISNAGFAGRFIGLHGLVVCRIGGSCPEVVFGPGYA